MIAMSLVSVLRYKVKSAQLSTVKLNLLPQKSIMHAEICYINLCSKQW